MATSIVGRKNLIVRQGNDKRWPIVLRHKDVTDPENPIYTPFDLSLYSFVSQVRTNIANNATEVVTNLTFSVTDAANGSGELSIASEDSGEMTGVYLYDLTLVRTADDFIQTVIDGELEVEPRISVVP